MKNHGFDKSHSDCPTGSFPGAVPCPIRRKLPHEPPPFAIPGEPVQFVTMNAVERGGQPFLSAASAILDAARFYHLHGRWFLRLFLVMPDHVHLLAVFPRMASVKATCGVWKGFLRRTADIRFQSDCFEHRIRNDKELSETWDYIRENPVRKGLVKTAGEWLHWLGFDLRTGAELPHGNSCPPRQL